MHKIVIYVTLIYWLCKWSYWFLFKTKWLLILSLSCVTSYQCPLWLFNSVSTSQCFPSDRQQRCYKRMSANAFRCWGGSCYKPSIVYVYNVSWPAPNVVPVAAGRRQPTINHQTSTTTTNTRQPYTQIYTAHASTGHGWWKSLIQLSRQKGFVFFFLGTANSPYCSR